MMQENNKAEKAYAELEHGVYAALETYSNVHRGSGHNSVVTTHLYEQAREIVLDYLGISDNKFLVIFCTPARASAMVLQLDPECFQSVSSADFGLPLGVCALVIDRKVLPKGTPFQTGGGTTRLISREWVLWADAPDRFEAGTPAIINVIAFARTLQLIRLYGKDIFRDPTFEKMDVDDILHHDELDEYSGRELLSKLKQTLIGHGTHVPTMSGNLPFINLDNSASTQTFTPVWSAVRHSWRQPEATRKEIVREVTSICAGALGAPAKTYDLVFTSNATEAINLAARSLGRATDVGTEPVVINTILEHSSNDLPWRFIPHGSLIRLEADEDGFIDPGVLEKILVEYNEKCTHGNKRVRLVALSGASNVLGVCNDIAALSRIVHRFGAHLLVDAAQLIAHRKVSMEDLGIDYLAFSAHKVYAPFGCGMLVVRKGLLNLTPEELLLIRSSGEENVGGIAALGKAFVLLQRIGMDLIREEEQALTSRLLKGMLKIDGLRIYGIKDPDSPRFGNKLGVVLFSLKGIMADRMAKELAVRGGIGVRAGCLCAHILIKHLLNFKPFFEKVQRLIVILFPMINLPGLARVSLGLPTSEKDVDEFIRVLAEIARKPVKTADNPHTPTDKGTISIPKKVVEQQMKDFTQATALKVYFQF